MLFSKLQSLRIPVAIALLLACHLPAHADRLSDQARAAIEQIVHDEMESQQVVGMAVGLIQHGQVVYTKGFGLANRERQLPVGPRTLFRWASISKPLTALAALQLVEQNRLDLDADVCKLVPEFPAKGKPITVRQLLCHQSGIVHYTNGKLIQTKRSYDSPHPFEDCILALDTFCESPLVAPPGTQFSYSTHAYILLSAVVQRAGRQKFSDQIADRIARPLKMTTLQPDYQWKSLPARAVGYRSLAGEIVRSTDTDVSWKLGGGGFVSNVEDLALLAAGLINGELVSGKTEKLMWTPQTTISGKNTEVGLGFFISQQNNRLKVFHNGAQEKSRTRLVIYPRERHAVVVMCNSEYAKPARFTTAIYRVLATLARAAN
ncbi:MAG: beta-lactamase family protein [Pirellulaceae bacterium]|nr:beta-lactamase family protein [Pirellulaceae bacterium]